MSKPKSTPSRKDAETRPKTTLTNSEFWQLVGLLCLAESHIKTLNEVRAGIGGLVGDPEDKTGWIADAVYGDQDIKQLMQRLKLKRKKARNEF